MPRRAEATIYATRLHLLAREIVEQELARLQVIVDKTAGPAEHEAMALITDYIRRVAGAARMSARVEEAVFVEAPARLHFGVLDLRGTMGRWFGGIGAAAPAPTLLVSASHADELRVEGEECARATEFARRLLAHVKRRGAASPGARVRVHRALPPTPGWAPARSSRWPSRVRWPTCTASTPTRPRSHA